MLSSNKIDRNKILKLIKSLQEEIKAYDDSIELSKRDNYNLMESARLYVINDTLKYVIHRMKNGLLK